MPPEIHSKSITDECCFSMARQVSGAKEQRHFFVFQRIKNYPAVFVK
jgi:hypothetical protein